MAWSDAARKAALEARRRNKKGQGSFRGGRYVFTPKGSSGPRQAVADAKARAADKKLASEIDARQAAFKVQVKKLGYAKAYAASLRKTGVPKKVKTRTRALTGSAVTRANAAANRVKKSVQENMDHWRKLKEG